MDVTPQDRDLMARTVLGEAGNQPDEGQAAVANVILNRVRSGQFGATPRQVIFAPNQFEPWSTRAAELNAIDPQSPQYQKALSLVDSAVAGAPDPTNGALYFLNEDIVRKRRGGSLPSWAQGNSVKIGAHTFYGMPMANQSDDLLENWSARGSQAQPGQPAQPAQGGGDDLLEMFGAPSTPAAPTAPAPTKQIPVITVHPRSTSPDGEEPLPETLNRLARQYEGDTSLGGTAARAGIGVLRGVGDVGDTLGEGITYLGAQGANALQRLGVISPETAQSVQQWRQRIDDEAKAQRDAYSAATQDSTASDVGRIGGNVLASGPLLEAGAATLVPNALRAGLAVRAAPAGANLLTRAGTGVANIGRAAVTGGATGAGATALTSAASDQPLGDQVTQGGIVGTALGPAGLGISRLGSKLIGGGIDQETAQLAQAAKQHGIDIGAGQLSNNTTVRFLDSVLRRLPFTGYAKQTAQQQGALEHAVAAEMGQSANKITPGVVRNALKDIGNEYDAINQQIGTLRIDQPFVNDLQNVYSNAKFNLEGPKARSIGNHIRNILDKVQNGEIDPAQYQALTRKNGPLDSAINSKDGVLSGYASQVKDALENLVWRNDPALKAAKDAADYKYFVAKSVQPLADEATTGGISGNKLLKAVDNSHTAVGELGRIARRFMVEPPSSGTAERSFILQHLPQLVIGLTGAGALGGATYFEPESYQRNALLALGMLAGTRGISSALRGNGLLGAPIANAMINRGLAGSAIPGTATNLLMRGLPAVGAIDARNSPVPAQP